MAKRWLLRRFVLLSILSIWFISLVVLGKYVNKLIKYQDTWNGGVNQMDEQQSEADEDTYMYKEENDDDVADDDDDDDNIPLVLMEHNSKPRRRFGDHTTRVIGPGEMGRPVSVDESELTERQLARYHKGWKDHGFNEYVSDLISLQRSLPDVRNPECKYLDYAKKLPDVSVIITFYNEAWSTLLRTIHSVLKTTPFHLLKEIILVDDFSDRPQLGKPLEDYIQRLDKVWLIRAPKRQGLIRARLLGYSNASAAVLMFLDSHIECTKGWLEPLLDRIVKDRSTVVTPIIDPIDETDFSYKYQHAGRVNVGGFDWNLVFTWHDVPRSERARVGYKDHLPVRTPTMAGGLFAITRSFFTEIGTYDQGMDLWGGENLELSFKVWMCGGSLETVPCSRIGHVFRRVMPYKVEGTIEAIRRNRIRVAEVWMDEYKKYYYDKLKIKTIEYGNIMERKFIRQMLKCKSFDWYLKNVFPEMYVPGESTASGEIRNKLIDVCLHGPGFYRHVGRPLKIARCNSKVEDQYWVHTYSKRIRRDFGCIEYNEDSALLMSSECQEDKDSQVWEYKNDSSLFHVSTGKCLALSRNFKSLSLEECMDIDRHKWLWNRVRADGPFRW